MMKQHERAYEYGDGPFSALWVLVLVAWCAAVVVVTAWTLPPQSRSLDAATPVMTKFLPAKGFAPPTLVILPEMPDVGAICAASATDPMACRSMREFRVWINQNRGQMLK